MQAVIAATDNLEVIEAAVEDPAVEGARGDRRRHRRRTVPLAGAVVLTTGTFLRGLIHIGDTRIPAGRIGEAPALGLSDRLYGLGLRMGRLKTGTPPRLDGKTIDWARLQEQPGDVPPVPFSFLTDAIATPQIACHITYTTEETHRIIEANLSRAPMYSGAIESVGPRYCPSIEDKVVRFKDRASHQIFLEPEGLDDDTVYPNGISTSLPEDVQHAFLKTITGLENVHVKRPGYAIEYDFVDPRVLHPSLETRAIAGLFLAGQINGTTGYEEAGGQGLVAGINAAMAASGARDRFAVTRADGYLGVMIDDLVTRGVSEPYRMFTSRAEYRLMLRADNADQRLTPLGLEAGCVGKERRAAFEAKSQRLAAGTELLNARSLTPNEAGEAGLSINRDGRRRSAFDLLSYPEIDMMCLARIWPELGVLDEETARQLSIDARYAVYVSRQEMDVAAFRKDEAIAIPPDFSYEALPGLSNELRQKLDRQRPASLGQAARLDGMTPAALMLLLAHVKKGRAAKSA